METWRSDITVEVAALPDGTLGAWDPARRVITIAPGLTGRQRRAVIAHEMEHARHGDRPCLDPVLHARREQQTERAAARALIGVDQLVDALRWCRSEQEMAWHLHVDRAMVRARIAALTDTERAGIERRLAEGGAVA